MSISTTPYKSVEHLKTAEEKKAYAIERLEVIQDLYRGDPEAAHGQAEDVLLQLLKSLGAAEVAYKFEEVRNDIGFWYA
jgi:hypothetical protein